MKWLRTRLTFRRRNSTTHEARQTCAWPGCTNESLRGSIYCGPHQIYRP